MTRNFYSFLPLSPRQTSLSQHFAAHFVANWSFYSIPLCLHLQFNCTYHKAQDARPHFPWSQLEVQHETVENVTFSMELYNTSLFHHPQPPSFIQVMDNKPIFVEVKYRDNTVLQHTLFIPLL